MIRWFLFILAILAGAAAGLYYGLVVNPVRFADAPLNSLRIDYKTDYYLMVAEAYSRDGDLPQAVARLERFEEPPGRVARQALDFAEQQGYIETDLELMRTLATDLATWDLNLNLEQNNP